MGSLSYRRKQSAVQAASRQRVTRDLFDIVVLMPPSDDHIDKTLLVEFESDGQKDHKNYPSPETDFDVSAGNQSQDDEIVHLKRPSQLRLALYIFL